MSSREQSIQLPSNLFKGLVLNPTQLSSDPNSATLCSNVEKSANGQITVRKGTKQNFRMTQTLDHYNLYPFTYTYYDISDGSTKEELLALAFAMNGSFVYDSIKLYKLVPGTVTISYVGGTTGRLTLFPILSDPARNPTSQAQWDINLYNNGSSVFHQTLESCQDSAIVSSLSNISYLIQNINALAAYVCSPTSLPASAAQTNVGVWGPYIDHTFPNGSSYDLTYYDIVEIGTLESLDIGITDANFVIPSALNYANVIYFAYGTYEYKYDGLKVYRSGLPQATINAIADSAGGASKNAGDTFIYKLVFAKIDAKSNVIEGEDSDDTLTIATHVMTNTRNVDITINSLNAANFGHGYDARAASVNGTQSGVTTITVTSGHTLVAGDTAYFYDTIGLGEYVERLITSITSTSITIAGANVRVASGDIISNNVRVQIWRTKNTGVDFYLVAEVPNNSLSNTFTYNDGQSDTALIEPFTEQLRKHSLPPKTYFLTEHQGLKVSGGDPDYPNRVRWALPDDPEAYPLESNLIDVKGGGLSSVTALGTVDDDTFAIFKRTGHVLLDGTLDDLSFRILNRSNTGIGCTSFRTIANIGDENTLCGLSLNGPFVFNGRSPSLVLSSNIDPLFDPAVRADPQVNGTPTQSDIALGTYSSPDTINGKRSLERAIGFNDYLNKKYHLFIPAEIGTPGAYKVAVAPSCKWLVYDYDPAHLFWTEYTFYNRYRELSSAFYGQSVMANCGLALYQNKLWYGMATFRNNSGSYQTRACLGEFKSNGDIYDYSDDCSPIFIDIFYTPVTRVPGSASQFFKPLWIIIEKFLSNITSDPAVVGASPEFDPDFTLAVKSILNHKQYNSNPVSTSVHKTFELSKGRIVMRIKCISEKARAFQIQITNESADPNDFEKPAFDNIEFIYCTPYDPKSKETKG